MIDVIPGIYEADLKEISRKVSIVSPFVSWVQIDVSDGTFVAKKSCMELSKIAPIITDSQKDGEVSFEAHIMATRPEKFVKDLGAGGFKRIIAHIESDDPRIFLDEAQYESVEVGLAIDAPTELSHLDPFLEEIDMVLVMTAEAGASGQELMAETVEKIRLIHENYPDLPIEVDCGINDKTAKIVTDAGASRLVVTSYLFDHERDLAQSIAHLKGL